MNALPRPDRPTNRKSLNLATWFFMIAVAFRNSPQKFSSLPALIMTWVPSLTSPNATTLNGKTVQISQSKLKTKLKVVLKWFVEKEVINEWKKCRGKQFIHCEQAAFERRIKRVELIDSVRALAAAVSRVALICYEQVTSQTNSMLVRRRNEERNRRKGKRATGTRWLFGQSITGHP